MEKIQDLLKGLYNGNSQEFTSGISNLLSQRANDLVADYKAVAFSDLQEETELNEDLNKSLGDYKFISSDGEVTIQYKGKKIASGDFDKGADGYFINHPKFKTKFFDDWKETLSYFSKNNLKESFEDLQEISAFKRAEIAHELRHEDGWKNKRRSKPTIYDIVYFKVPFKLKDIAKEDGLKWDKNQKMWYLELGYGTAMVDVRLQPHLSYALDMYGNKQKDLKWVLDKIRFTRFSDRNYN